MKLILAIAVACVGFYTYAQNFTPLPKPQSQSSYGSPKGFDDSTKKDILKTANTVSQASESISPFYESTVVYHQIGDKLTAINLRIEDFNALEAFKRQILGINQQIAHPNLSQIEKTRLYNKGKSYKFHTTLY
jgi:hypothetical protein